MSVCCTSATSTSWLAVSARFGRSRSTAPRIPSPFTRSAHILLIGYQTHLMVPHSTSSFPCGKRSGALSPLHSLRFTPTPACQRRLASCSRALFETPFLVLRILGIPVRKRSSQRCSAYIHLLVISHGQARMEQPSKPGWPRHTMSQGFGAKTQKNLTQRDSCNPITHPSMHLAMAGSAVLRVGGHR
jgi:hypothetical protein